MADIVYTYGNSVYMNITNKCPCSCVFCIRSNGDGLGSAESLWLKKDPTLEEIEDEINKFDFSPYSKSYSAVTANRHRLLIISSQAQSISRKSTDLKFVSIQTGSATLSTARRLQSFLKALLIQSQSALTHRMQSVIRKSAVHASARMHSLPC